MNREELETKLKELKSQINEDVKNATTRLCEQYIETLLALAKT